MNLGIAMQIRKNQQGMTLVEVLIAAALILVGFTATMGAVSEGYLNVRASGGQTQATTYARQLIEQFRAQPFCPAAPPCFDPNPPAPGTGTDIPAPGFVRNWTVALVPGTAAPRQVANVTVRVIWRAGWSRSQNITIQTRIGAPCLTPPNCP